MKVLSPQYRKYFAALVGTVAQVVGLLATASDAGVLPPSWRPWVVVAVAVLTALGVRQAPNDRAPEHAAAESDAA